MTTTTTYLNTNDSAKVALVLLFDGVNLAYTNTNDTTGLATAYAATDFTTFKSGLFTKGTIEQTLSLFAPQLPENNLNFEILDHDGTLIATLFKSYRETFLAEDQDNSTTDEIKVNDATTIAASGTGYIGYEAFAYTGRTFYKNVDNSYDALTGLTRGKFSIYGPNGGTRFGRYHRVNPDTDPTTIDAPGISSEPRVWHGRGLRLMLHHYENGAWSTFANSHTLWAGTLNSWAEEAQGLITLNCHDYLNKLQSDVFRDQFHGKINYGLYFTAGNTNRDFGVALRDDVAPNSINSTWETTSAVYTYADVLSKVQEVFSTWYADNDVTVLRYSIGLVQTDDGFRVKVQAKGAGASAGDIVEVGLHWKVWHLLGWEITGNGRSIIEAGQMVTWRRLKWQGGSSDTFDLIAPKAPILYHNIEVSRDYDQIAIADYRGVWINQPTTPVEYSSDADTAGFIALGDQLLGVASPTLGTQVANFEVTEYPGKSGRTSDNDVVRLDDTVEIPTVKQVWIERGKLGDILLKLMLSTGTPGYNHATYDVYTGEIGLGIPANLVDITSFKTLTNQYELRLNGPTPFADLLESACAVYNRYPVFRNGQISLTPPGFDALNNEDIIAIDEDSKTSVGDRTGMVLNREQIVNEVKLIYDDKLPQGTSNLLGQVGGQASAASGNRILDYTARALQSISEHGVKSITIKAQGILDPISWIDDTAAPILAYFSQPTATLKRTYNAKHIDLVPGDVIKLTDSAVLDPRTGTRGISSLPAFITSTKWDISTGAGEFEAVLLPNHDSSTYVLYGPSAKVDDGAANGGYNAGTFTLTLDAHEFSRAADSADVTFFSAGDEVTIREYSPASGTGNVWNRVIASVDTNANTVTLTSGLSSPAWDSAKEYIVEFDDKVTVGTSQEGVAFIAAKTTLSTETPTQSLYNDAASSTRAYITDASQTGLENDPFSVECWFYAKSISSTYKPLFSKCTSTLGYRLRIKDTAIELATGFGGTLLTSTWTTTTAANTWYHLALTRTNAGGTWKLYINGSEVSASRAQSMTPGSTADFSWNYDPVTGVYGDFLISEGRYWSVQRSAAQILANYATRLVGNETNLTSLWPFDGDLLDATATGNDLTASGTLFVDQAPSELQADLDKDFVRYSGDTYNMVSGVEDGTAADSESYYRLDLSSFAEVGEPLSSWKPITLLRNVSNIANYKSRNVLVSEPWVNRQITGSTPTLIFGPIYVPLYGNNIWLNSQRELVVITQHKRTGSAGTATVQVYSGATPIKGSSTTSLVAPRGARAVSHLNTTTTIAINESVITPAVTMLGDNAGTWIWALAYGSGAGVVSDVQNITVIERNWA